MEMRSGYLLSMTNSETIQPQRILIIDQDIIFQSLLQSKLQFVFPEAHIQTQNQFSTADDTLLHQSDLIFVNMPKESEEAWRFITQETRFLKHSKVILTAENFGILDFKRATACSFIHSCMLKPLDDTKLEDALNGEWDNIANYVLQANMGSNKRFNLKRKR